MVIIELKWVVELPVYCGGLAKVLVVLLYKQGVGAAGHTVVLSLAAMTTLSSYH